MTCAEAADQIRSVALGLIAEGIQPGDRRGDPVGHPLRVADHRLRDPVGRRGDRADLRDLLGRTGAVRPRQLRGASIIFAETDAHAETVEQLRGQLPELRKVLRIDGHRHARAGSHGRGRQVSRRRRARQAAGRDPFGRPGDPDLHLRHHRSAQGLPADPREPALRDQRGQGLLPALQLAPGERMLVFLPLAHVLARAITIAAFTNKVTLGFTSDIKNLVPTFGVFTPTLGVSRCPACSRRSTTPPSRTPATTARARSSRSPPTPRSSGARRRTPAAPACCCAPSTLLFDKLVYGKLRAALGGECRAAISGGAPLGARLGHFYRGVGLSIYEGYGLTETSAAITVNRVNDLKVGSVGKLMPRQQHAYRRGRRAAGQGRRGVQRLLGQRVRDQRGVLRRLVPHR